MQNTRKSSLLAMAALALSGAAGMSAMVQPSPGQVDTTARASTRQVDRNDQGNSPSRMGERNSIAKALLGGFGRIGRRNRFPNGPGWTQAHVKRMARKRRGQQRNKRAHRG